MTSTFQFSGGAITDVGLRRSSNQDNYLYSEELGLYVVADGMGGHSGGETASRIAVETMKSFYTEHASDLKQPLDPQAEMELLRQGVEAANRAIYEHAQVHTELRGMGTTLVSLRVRGQMGFVAHVGDSRLYRVDGTGLKRVTKDHSRVQELIDAKQLTEVEAQSILGRNIITRALGNRPHVEVDTQILDLRGEEGYMLCSDGLCGVLNDQETFAVCQASAMQPPAPEPMLVALVERVKQSGAPDNVTVLLLLGEHFAEGRAQSSVNLVDFDLPAERLSTHKAGLSASDDESKEETKPLVLARPLHDALRLAGPELADSILNRSTTETMAVLGSLVKQVAASRGVDLSIESAEASRPAVMSIDEPGPTAKAVPSVPQQPPRAVPATRAAEDAEPPRSLRPTPNRTDALQGTEPPARRSRAPIFLVVGLIPVLLIGFVLFGPARSQYLVIETTPEKNGLLVKQVSLPVGSDLGQTLLEGPLGGALTSMRKIGTQELSLPEAVPDDVWRSLRSCPPCSVLASGKPLVETGDGQISAFAARLYEGLGDHYRDKKRHELARQFYETGENFLGEAAAKVRIARDFYIEGIELQENKDYQGALGNFSKALELGGVEEDLKARLASAAFEQCQVLLASGKPQEARAAYDLARQHGFPEKAELELLLNQAAAQPTPIPKLEVAPPPLPETQAPTAVPEESGEGGEKETLNDPFRDGSAPASEPQPTPATGATP